jgi:hypothetical protein
MERLPINPDELEAEQEAAQSAVQEEEAATHENHHKAWIHTHRLAAVKPHAALSTEAERAAEEEQELLKDEADEEEDEFQVWTSGEGLHNDHGSWEWKSISLGCRTIGCTSSIPGPRVVAGGQEVNAAGMVHNCDVPVHHTDN